MITINAKPLSINDAWQGKRFKSKKYKEYEKWMHTFPQDIPLVDETKPMQFHYIFGFSNKASDVDNCIKNVQDMVSKVYGFNDSLIYKIIAEKQIVPKGQEYTKIFISNL